MRPKYVIKRSRKDGKPIKFKNYKGETVEKKYAPVGALFENQFGGFNFVLDDKATSHTVDTDTFYYNVFPKDDGPQDDAGDPLEFD